MLRPIEVMEYRLTLDDDRLHEHALRLAEELVDGRRGPEFVDQYFMIIAQVYPSMEFH